MTLASCHACPSLTPVGTSRSNSTLVRGSHAICREASRAVGAITYGQKTICLSYQPLVEVRVKNAWGNYVRSSDKEAILRPDTLPIWQGGRVGTVVPLRCAVIWWCCAPWLLPSLQGHGCGMNAVHLCPHGRRPIFLSLRLLPSDCSSLAHRAMWLGTPLA